MTQGLEIQVDEHILHAVGLHSILASQGLLNTTEETLAQRKLEVALNTARYNPKIRKE